MYNFTFSTRNALLATAENSPELTLEWKIPIGIPRMRTARPSIDEIKSSSDLVPAETSRFLTLIEGVCS